MKRNVSVCFLVILALILSVAIITVQNVKAASADDLPTTPSPVPVPVPSPVPVEEKPLEGVTIETIEDGTGNNGNVTCCNTCPTPSIIVVPKYTTIKVPIRIPFPVLKPIPHHDKCPSDYVFVPPNKCTKTVIIKKQVNCPIGFVRISETECLRMITVVEHYNSTKILCPPGFIPFTLKIDSDEYNKLKEREGQDDTFFFKNITQGVVYGCKKDVEIEIPPFTCPKGYYHQSPYHCIKVIECPKQGGWIKTADGKCIRTLFNCPPGFKKLGRFGLKCIKIKVPCPKGYKQSKKSPRLCLKTRIIIKIKCPASMFYSEAKKTCIFKKCQNVKCHSNLKCPKGQVPRFNSKKDCCPSCQPCTCGASYHPVCTRDGVTVFNLCTAKCLGLEVVYEGACKITEIQKILKVCPPCEQCKNKKRRPVCGVDGVTYPNYCVAKCVTSGKFVLKKKGKCTKADCTEGENNKLFAEFLPFFERVLKSDYVNAKKRE